MPKRFVIDYINEVVYSNNEEGECANVYGFGFLDNLKKYCPDIAKDSDVYEAYLYYRDITRKPFPLLEGMENE